MGTQLATLKTWKDTTNAYIRVEPIYSATGFFKCMADTRVYITYSSSASQLSTDVDFFKRVEDWEVKYSTSPKKSHIRTLTLAKYMLPYDFCDGVVGSKLEFADASKVLNAPLCSTNAFQQTFNAYHSKLRTLCDKIMASYFDHPEQHPYAYYLEKQGLSMVLCIIFSERGYHAGKQTFDKKKIDVFGRRYTKKDFKGRMNKLKQSYVDILMRMGCHVEENAFFSLRTNTNTDEHSKEADRQRRDNIRYDEIMRKIEVKVNDMLYCLEQAGYYDPIKFYDKKTEEGRMTRFVMGKVEETIRGIKTQVYGGSYRDKRVPNQAKTHAMKIYDSIFGFSLQKEQLQASIQAYLKYAQWMVDQVPYKLFKRFHIQYKCAA